MLGFRFGADALGSEAEPKLEAGGADDAAYGEIGDTQISEDRAKNRQSGGCRGLVLVFLV